MEDNGANFLIYKKENPAAGEDVTLRLERRGAHVGYLTPGRGCGLRAKVRDCRPCPLPGVGYPTRSDKVTR